MARKVTLTLDGPTVDALRALSERRGKPQSMIVREAIAVYARQETRLDDEERIRRLRVLDDVAAAAPTRPAREVQRELREVRQRRRSGWRRPSD